MRAKELTSLRDGFEGQTLADLYSPDLMPKALSRAHRRLDKAVDKCYRSQPFTSELSRLRFLFRLYGEYSPMTRGLEEFEEDNVVGDKD